MNLQHRFMSHVEKTGSCWLWQGSKHYKGYGQFNVAGRVMKAHRVSYELFVGPIPPRAQLDHLCRVRHCVNPVHLEPTTNRQNVIRGLVFLGKKAQLPLGVNQVGRRFRAQKKVEGKPTHIGYFDTPEEAHLAYLEYGGSSAA